MPPPEDAPHAKSTFDGARLLRDARCSLSRARAQRLEDAGDFPGASEGGLDGAAKFGPKGATDTALAHLASSPQLVAAATQHAMRAAVLMLADSSLRKDIGDDRFVAFGGNVTRRSTLQASLLLAGISPLRSEVPPPRWAERDGAVPPCADVAPPDADPMRSLIRSGGAAVVSAVFGVGPGVGPSALTAANIAVISAPPLDITRVVSRAQIDATLKRLLPKGMLEAFAPVFEALLADGGWRLECAMKADAEEAACLAPGTLAVKPMLDEVEDRACSLVRTIFGGSDEDSYNRELARSGPVLTASVAAAREQRRLDCRLELRAVIAARDALNKIVRCDVDAFATARCFDTSRPMSAFAEAALRHEAQSWGALRWLEGGGARVSLRLHFVDVGTELQDGAAAPLICSIPSVRPAINTLGGALSSLAALYASAADPLDARGALNTLPLGKVFARANLLFVEEHKQSRADAQWLEGLSDQPVPRDVFPHSLLLDRAHRIAAMAFAAHHGDALQQPSCVASLMPAASALSVARRLVRLAALVCAHLSQAEDEAEMEDVTNPDARAKAASCGVAIALDLVRAVTSTQLSMEKGAASVLSASLETIESLRLRIPKLGPGDTKMVADGTVTVAKALAYLNKDECRCIRAMAAFCGVLPMTEVDVRALENRRGVSNGAGTLEDMLYAEQIDVQFLSGAAASLTELAALRSVESEVESCAHNVALADSLGREVRASIAESVRCGWRDVDYDALQFIARKNEMSIVSSQPIRGPSLPPLRP